MIELLTLKNLCCNFFMDFSYIPALVQVQEPWQKMYLGCCAGKGTCASLDMVHLKKVPPHCRYLTGISYFYLF